MSLQPGVLLSYEFAHRCSQLSSPDPKSHQALFDWQIRVDGVVGVGLIELLDDLVHRFGGVRRTLANALLLREFPGQANSAPWGARTKSQTEALLAVTVCQVSGHLVMVEADASHRERGVRARTTL